MTTSALSSREILRYSRHTMLPSFGVDAQLKLKNARVLIIGLGGLGSAVAPYLASAGVGTLLLADGDHVELSNLQRQVLHSESRLQMNKAESAAIRLTEINSDINYQCITEQLDEQALAALCGSVDAVVDASDNFATRFASNRACLQSQTPLISAAAIRGEGQLSVFDSRIKDTPCYRCLYPEAAEGQETCAANGVLAPLVGILGSMQALETIKVLTGVGQPAIGKLLLFDAWQCSWRELKLRQDPACPECGRA